MQDIIYGSMNVDQRFAASFEPNLYHQAWMIPGVTFSNHYQSGVAGGYQVHKYVKEDTIVPGKPGRDFSHENAEDDLVSIVLNNNFQKSRKLYGVAMNAIEANAAEELMADTTMLAKESINGSGLAALVTEATAFSKTGTVTKDNIKDTIMEVRAALSSKGASSAKVILASPEAYSAFLAQAGKDFNTGFNERVQGTGVINDWYGFTIVEASQLGGSGSYSYYNHADTLKTVAAATLNAINFVVYDYRAFSALTNLEVYRLIDGGKDFNGVLSQVEVNMGFRVTNPDLVFVHKKSAS